VSSRPVPARLAFPGAKIRCVLAHDHVLLRQGLRRLLEDEPDIEVISEAGNASECLRKVDEFRPDVVVADARSLGLAVPDPELSLSRGAPGTKFVFLSTQKPSNIPSDHAGSRAGGCDVRQASAEDLAQIVRSLCLDDPDDRQASSYSSDDAPILAARALTAREREVLKLLAEGKTVRMAASVLGLSSKTVDSHKFNLMRKLGLHNKAELVMWAIQKKLVTIPANF
jgi:two-component system, NarL family, response regulator NreC